MDPLNEIFPNPVVKNLHRHMKNISLVLGCAYWKIKGNGSCMFCSVMVMSGTKTMILNVIDY